jgi:bla regulator protein BlaR1
MRRATIAFFVLLTAAIAAADDFNYVFTRSGQALISGDLNLDAVLSIRKRYPGDFLWARWKGQAYVIRDAATIAEARAAFAQADALHVEYERLSARMRPLERREEELEHEIDRIGDALSDGEVAGEANIAKMEQKLRDLEAKMKPVARELRQLENEEERLDAREEKLVAAAESQLRRIVDRAVARGLAERVR